ncbi:hypothetical protein NPX13_g7093 [Xylaria arbuscula]|uniref:SAM domain-containing protein n=1 Tax=Xylaria arbuscula TaxID=114810 RepID=A0A9W8NAZ8_9PEZI|nr:hypothetical protein NPX13_g7093 [Xylaria arbuscula]
MSDIWNHRVGLPQDYGLRPPVGAITRRVEVNRTPARDRFSSPPEAYEAGRADAYHDAHDAGYVVGTTFPFHHRAFVERHRHEFLIREEEGSRARQPRDRPAMEWYTVEGAYEIGRHDELDRGFYDGVDDGRRYAIAIWPPTEAQENLREEQPRDSENNRYNTPGPSLPLNEYPLYDSFPSEERSESPPWFTQGPRPAANSSNSDPPEMSLNDPGTPDHSRGVTEGPGPADNNVTAPETSQHSTQTQQPTTAGPSSASPPSAPETNPQADSSVPRRRSPKEAADRGNLECLEDIPQWLWETRLQKYTACLADLHWREMVMLVDDAALEKRGVKAKGARDRLLKKFLIVRQNTGMV